MILDHILNSVHVGHVLPILRSLPDEFVDCVVTSPPYFGLRSYPVESQVWGGDSGCVHQWGDEIPGSSRGGSGTPTDKNNRGEGYGRGERRGNFCACGAWRGHLGLEPTPKLFVEHLVEIFREVRRVLQPHGTMWVNIADCYGAGGGAQVIQTKDASYGLEGMRGAKSVAAKQLVGVPWRLALALQSDDWYLRSDIIWSVVNHMPESMEDRGTMAHEYIFMLAKRGRYYYDNLAVREEPKLYVRKGGKTPYTADGMASHGEGSTTFHSMAPLGANLRSVWSFPTQPCEWEYCDSCGILFVGKERSAIKKGAGDGKDIQICPSCGASNGWVEHYAAFPKELPRRCILLGTSEKGNCAKCGTPWKRVVERKSMVIARTGRRDKMNAEGVGQFREQGRTQTSGTMVSPPQARTVGWEPTCQCGAQEAKPAIVLDPFSGSGTTGLMAVGLGRNFVGIELSDKYARASAARIRRAKAELARNVKEGDPERRNGQAPSLQRKDAI